MIPFNKPYFTGNEIKYIDDAVKRGHISGNGFYTKKCQEFFENRYGFGKALLTTSCTDALEMCALLLDIKPGDEIIVPSFTFVSTALAFVRQGAKIVFVDSCDSLPNIDPDRIEKLITVNTKAIVVVHYAGLVHRIDDIQNIASKHDLILIEDAAQAIEVKYKGQYAGSFGHLSTFSFHETKNISAGEGGMLVINDERFTRRAQIIWEKGTNRIEFFNGEVDKYSWVDTGSSFLPSEIISATLWAQLERIEDIIQMRVSLWNTYKKEFVNWLKSNELQMMSVPENSSNNGHMFYIICRDKEQRNDIIAKLKSMGIMSVFHYQSLHNSPFYQPRHDGRSLPNSDRFSDCLLRMPLFYELDIKSITTKLEGWHVSNSMP
ncbi:dTDP-4-amino-4,6-dideoxygalactose transaminase, partial [Flavobacteriaceae bacterium]|nr:dTDP-4-amino-4,6-dideoxygalactose transaminase [Flavobacteriaceae bacterium]